MISRIHSRKKSELILVTFLTATFCFTSLMGEAAEPVGTLVIKNDGPRRTISYPGVSLPQDWFPESLEAVDEHGNAVPLQPGDSNTAWFRIDNLAAGEERALRIFKRSSSVAIPTGVDAHRVGRKIEFWSDKRRILDYQAEPGDLPRDDISDAYRRGGYIHPIWSPAGRMVTDDFPENHVHHHGVWFPWTKTKFEGREPDFWNMGAGSGRVEFVQLENFASGAVFAELKTKHQFVDLTVEGGKIALNETWQLRVFATPEDSNAWIFDLESVQSCATDSPLLLPEYRYGGLGFRGHWDWNGKENTFFLTSNGETDRVKGHATRADWCYVGGETAGKRTGIVIMCHPENFRAPQPMRLHPTEPFFCYAPQQAGDMSIEPGIPYVSKYRFLVIDGEPDADLIDLYWSDYANPLNVTFR